MNLTERPWLPGTILVLLILAAYRGLWWQPGSADVGSIVFTPGAIPGLMVLAIGSWFLWRRRAIWDLNPQKTTTRPVRALTVVLAALSMGCFAWAVLVAKSDLQFLSLAAGILAWAVAFRGASRIRPLLLPVLVLLVGIRIPKPIEDEIVWALQLGTARWSHALLDIFGYDFDRAGVVLRGTHHTFQVIDSCSGLSGTLILFLVALCVCEILTLRGWRFWLCVAFVPPLGFLLNVIRVAYVAGSAGPSDPAAIGADHTLQGLAVLMGGTVLLYSVGRLLERGPAETRRIEPSSYRGELIGWKPAALFLAAFLVISIVAGPMTFESQPEAEPAAFPTRAHAWTSESAPDEPYFNGLIEGKIHRRYRHRSDGNRPFHFVDVLIGQQSDAPSFATRQFSSKRLLPGAEWNLREHTQERVWILDRDVDIAVASATPDSEHAMVYTWRIRHRGWIQESWRDLLALDRGWLRREAQPTLVKIVAYAPHGGGLALDEAKQQILRFIADYHADLKAL